MEEATHAAWILVLSEACARAKPLIVSNEASVVASSTSYETRLAALFVISYVLCIATILCKVKDIPFFQTDFVRNVTTVLHALDGVNALLIGLGMYYQNLYIVAIGLLCMTKVFLLHLLSRMVTGIKTHSLWSVVVQTTKTFLHHVGSFLFIAPTDHNVILITALWRFVSMNGHAAMTLRKHISAERYQWLMWKISHMRNAVLVVVLLLCFLDNSIRDGFGKLFVPATSLVLYFDIYSIFNAQHLQRAAISPICWCAWAPYSASARCTSPRKKL